MVLTPLGINYVHTCNPWVAVWWSVALPGLGHFYLGSYLKGFILMSWEILLNSLSHLNLSIYYSLLGDIDRAKQVLVMKWVFFYPAAYLLAMWDSYRLAVELNWLAKVERFEQPRHFQFQNLGVWGHAMLVKRSPWVAWFWSTFVCGAGHLYNAQLLKGVMLMGWQVALLALSSVSSGMYHTLVGAPAVAAKEVRYQWLLFMPSIYLFNMWDAYQDCVEQNKLTEEARLDWLRQQTGREDVAQTVVGVMLTTADLERAVLALQQRGFTSDAIRWGELEKHGKTKEPHGLREWLTLGGALGDTLRRADGISLMDGATAGATIASLLGIVYGSVWPIGPIGGGALGILAGGFIGWACDRWVRRGRSRESETDRLHKLGCIVHVSCMGHKRVKAAKTALKEAEAVLISVVR